MHTISLVVAVGPDRVIGKDNGMPWPRIKADLQHFVRVTKGHPVIMGRLTWDSFPEEYRPLPDRSNIVLTRQYDFQPKGAIVVNSLDSALQTAKHLPGAEDICIIGGGQIYHEAIQFADRIVLTKVHGAFDGDTFFPPYESEFPTQVSYEVVTEKLPQGVEKLEFITLER